MQQLTYATTEPLVRAESIYNSKELQAKGLSPEAKITSTGQTSIIFHQAWKKNTSTLLKASTFTELLVTNNTTKTVAIVHGLCNPPLITIDPDNLEKATLLMDIVKALPQEQQPLVISKGIGKAGYNFTYHNTPDNKLLTDYILDIHKGGLGDDLDVLFSNDKVMFMANKGNRTKELIAINEPADGEIRGIPKVLQLATMGLFKDSRPEHLDVRKESGSYLPEHTNQTSQLGFMFKGFNPQDSTTPVLLNNFIAKRAKADLKENFNAPEDEAYPYQPKYYTQKPNDLLFRLSGSLKNDSGIGSQQHALIIQTINSLLPHAKNFEQLQKEILMPDTKEPYNYDPQWETKTASIYNDHKQVVDIYRVTQHTSASPHMLHNTETGEIRLFKTAALLKEELQGETSLPKKRLGQIQEKARLVDLIERPDQTFGLLTLDKDTISKRQYFNIYKRTALQEMFYNPEDTHRMLKHKYKYPKTIIAAIESQMGKEKTHELFLPYIRRKLMTREPSPLIFALMGPPHSFKTGLVEGILKPLFSSRRYLKTSGDILTEKYNDFLINLDILVIDEIHHLIGTPLLKPVIQTLNKFGAEYHEGIRHMYSSVNKGEDVLQEVTPFVTMNKIVVPASEIVGERRLVVGYSTRPLREALNLDDPDIKTLIKNEMLDFAMYLSLDVENISAKNYGHNQKWKDIDDHYYRFMQGGISKLKQLTLAIGSTVDLPKLDVIQELMGPKPLRECLIKLTRSSHNSQYRLRLWNAEGSFTPDVPGVIDHIDDISYSDIPKSLEMNDNVLKPSMVSAKIRQNKQDLVVTEELLRLYNYLDDNGDILGEAISDDIPGDLDL